MDELDWGPGWERLDPSTRPFADQLARELGPGHPLHGSPLVAIGRCLACDDVAVELTSDSPTEPRLAVIHLTWQPRSPRAPEWPWHERLTRADFMRRFVRGGEHL
jgi:hypothetical protein